MNVNQLINLLADYADECEVEIVYETYAHSRIAAVTAKKDCDETVVQIVAAD